MSNAFAAGEDDRSALRARARGRAFVEALRRGDTRALELAFRAYGSDLRLFAGSFTSTAEEAADVVQEVFIRLPKRLGPFRGDCDLWTWLRMMTRDTALERTRRARRRRRREARWWLASRGVRQNLDEALDRVALERALAALPESYRTVLLLRDAGLSHREIGERLGISAGLSSTWLSRARRQLRELL